MRIAIVSGPYVPVPPIKFGGTEAIVHNLIKGLRELGHQPVLLGPGDSKTNCHLIPTIDKALYFPRGKNQFEKHSQLIRKSEIATIRKLKALLPRIDIIHSHGFDMTRFKHLPNITTLHNQITFDDINYFTRRKNLPYVAVSANQQSALPYLNYVGLVCNGEDAGSFPIVKKPKNYICFFGSMNRDRNPVMAIKLALSLKQKIKLAGSVDYYGRAYFRNEIKPYLGHPLVEYLGEIGYREKIKLISNAKCNVHPIIFREPFDLTVLEAAYCGTPTLAIIAGTMPELIEPGRTGLLVEDLVAGRHYIEKCYEMDREYIAQRARKLFNHLTMASEYIEIYKKLINAYKKKTLQITK